MATSPQVSGDLNTALSARGALQAGRVAVITGAAHGIGLAAAKHCAGLGMKVVLADIDAKALEDAKTTVSAVASDPSHVLTSVTDVRDLSQVQALKDTVYSEFGEVGLLMNNAGVGAKGRSYQAEDAKNWDFIMGVNFSGVLHGVQTFTQAMLNQNTHCLIMNTGSKQGITTPPGNTAYNVSKAAVKVLTEGLQHDLRNTEGSKVNAALLVPGWVNTNILLNERKRQDPNYDESKAYFSTANPRPAAWSAEATVNHGFEKAKDGQFYIICPDPETPWAKDQFRITWASQDMTAPRVPLSRWHADYKEDFASKCP